MYALKSNTQKKWEIQLTLKSISICTGARWWRRGLGPDNGSKGALLFHCRDDIGRWEWENAVCTATVWREGDRRGCHGRAWRHYCNKAKIIRTQIEVFHGKHGKREWLGLASLKYQKKECIKKNNNEMPRLGHSLDNRQTLLCWTYFCYKLCSPIFFSLWDCIMAQTDQFTISIFTSSLQSHPSFYPVADIIENQNNASIWFCTKYESIWWCVTKNKHLLP